MGKRGVVLVTWADLRAGGFDAVEERLDSLASQDNRVVFNIAGFSHLDSSVLVYLIQTHRRLRELGGELVFSEPSKFMQSMITTIGMHKLFRIYPNDDDALRHFGHDGDDDSGGVGSRLKPWQPSDSGMALPEDEPPDEGA